MFAPRRRRAGGGFGILMLGASLMRVGVDKVPPVTLAFVAINTGIFMRLLPGLPKVWDACVSNQLVFKERQLIRLVLASFYHLDDMHLYYNMASFIYKGMKLEPRFGMRRYFIILVSFALSSQLVLLLLNMVAAEIFNNRSYLTTCAAGFSAVLFALKVLMTHYSEQNGTSLMGIPINIPAKYAFWAELVVIQILVPNASFTGHLAGILVGLAFTKGPLKSFVFGIDNFISGASIPSMGNQGPSYTYRAGTAGGQPSGSTRRPPLNNDERELQEALRRSLQDYKYDSRSSAPNPGFQTAPSYGWNVGAQGDSNDAHSSNSAPSQTSRANYLYPDLPAHSPTEPSAPPLPFEPTETEASSPLASPDEAQRIPTHPTHEEVRQLRLRKYEKGTR